MKRLITTWSFGLFLALALSVSERATAQPRVGVNISFQTFYDELSPYGEWIDYPDYGYTWRPRVGNDFRPYSSRGRWVYADDDDWMWASDYDWGWAPFHYGRWFYDPYYGWLWVPGYEWSPGWVAWRGGGDYYGWAPLRPGISINIGFGNYNPPYDYWTFTPCRYMGSRYMDRYYYPYRNNVTIINNTTIINNYGGRNYGGRRYYSNGPRRSDVERYSGRIQPVRVRDASRPGRTSIGRNEVSVYRPAVQRGNDNTRYAPRSVQQYSREADRSSAGRGSVEAGRRGEAARSRYGGNGSGADVRADRNVYGDRRSRGGQEVSEGRGADRTVGDARASSDNEQLRQRRGNMENARNSDGVVRQRDQQIEMRRSQESAQRAGQMRQQRDQQTEARRSQENAQRAEQMRQQRDQQTETRRSQENAQRTEQMRQQRDQQIEARRSQESTQRAQQMQQRESQRQEAARSQQVQIQRSAPARSDGGGYSRGRGGESSSRGSAEGRRR
ncbi:DUF6600 domain-containing protein [Niabella hirudinis]|uniref:DUF6600 domain-containing protein n=1 Tax=Niabella hirudinis TaxID=1285929 RepID=UPI003EB6D9C4